MTDSVATTTRTIEIRPDVAGELADGEYCLLVLSDYAVLLLGPDPDPDMKLLADTAWKRGAAVVRLNHHHALDLVRRRPVDILDNQGYRYLIRVSGVDSDDEDWDDDSGD